MTQDQAKEFLEPLAQGKPLTVIFSGKRSKTKNGMFHSETNEIIIHNRNFTNDEGLKYTALHELAHMIEYATHGKTNHAGRYQAILSGLITQARAAGTYKPDHSPVEKNIKELKAKLAEHAKLEHDIGTALTDMVILCAKHDVRAEEVIDQSLRITMRTAKRLMAVGQLELFPEATTDTQTAIVQAPKQVKAEVKAAIVASEPVSQVKAMGKPKTKPIDPEDSTPQLLKEAKRIDVTMERLAQRREEIDCILESREQPEGPKLVMTTQGDQGLRYAMMNVSRGPDGHLIHTEVGGTPDDCGKIIPGPGARAADVSAPGRLGIPVPSQEIPDGVHAQAPTYSGPVLVPSPEGS